MNQNTNNNSVREERPLIWVSSCLLGNAVRYDGKDKANQNIILLCKVLPHVSICPELAMGMGVPRPSIAWYRDRLLENDSKIEHTDKTLLALKNIFADYPVPQAAIVKSKSPSCGLGDVPIHGTEDWRNGFFTQAILDTYPNISVVDENTLSSIEGLTRFIGQLSLTSKQRDDLQSIFPFLA